MTNGQQKRPWFQFHLSTAVVLMFAAPGMLRLNTIHTATMRATSDALEARGYGCPVAFWYVGWEKARMADGSIGHVRYEEFRPLEFTVALALNLAFLFAVGVYVERFTRWRIRRRDRRE